jgi:hypothetical protein
MADYANYPAMSCVGRLSWVSVTMPRVFNANSADLPRATRLARMMETLAHWFEGSEYSGYSL